MSYLFPNLSVRWTAIEYIEKGNTLILEFVPRDHQLLVRALYVLVPAKVVLINLWPHFRRCCESLRK